MTFEKVDDILTDEARENLMKDFVKEVNSIKHSVMDLIAIELGHKYDYNNSIDMFDILTEINGSLGEIADVIHAYDTEYTELKLRYKQRKADVKTE